jgi:outer membrane protein W
VKNTKILGRFRDIHYLPAYQDGSNLIQFSETQIIGSPLIALYLPKPIMPFIGVGASYALMINQISTSLEEASFATRFDHSIGPAVYAGVDFFQNRIWGIRLMGSYAERFIKRSDHLYFAIHFGFRF